MAQPYSVEVESSDHYANWVDIFVVIADSETEACNEARRFMLDNSVRNVDGVEAYLLEGPSRVVGRLIDSGEE